MDDGSDLPISSSLDQKDLVQMLKLKTNRQLGSILVVFVRRPAAVLYTRKTILK